MLARFASLWRQDDWRALLAGLVYALVYSLVSQMDWQSRLRETRYRRRHSGLTGAVQRAGIPVARELVALTLTLGYPFLMVILGVFSPGDLGLGMPNWGRVLAPVLVGALVATVWLAFLWTDGIAVWRSTKALPGERPPALPFTVTGALLAEGHLATCRAALMPLFGSYWGMWMGVALRMLVAHTSPYTQWQLQSPVERRRVYLDWALDWVSTAILASTGTVWAGLLVRVLCRTTLHLLRGRRAPAAETR